MSSIERSKLLRKKLVESLEPKEVPTRIDEHTKYASRERKQEVQARLEEAEEQLEDLEAEAQKLLSHAEQLSDEEFEEQFARIEGQIASLELSMTQYKGQSERKFVTEYVAIEKIETLDQFIEQGPMYWIPRKAEIARMVTCAVQAHTERVKRGEKDVTDPIDIIDIGGANAALGRLMVKFAKEHGLNVKYTIVDPDRATLEKTQQALTDQEEFEFIEGTANDFVMRQYADQPELLSLFKQKQARIEFWNAKLKDLFRYLTLLEKQYDSFDGLDPKDQEELQEILEKDFSIQTDDIDFSDGDELQIFLQKGASYGRQRNALERFSDMAQEEVLVLTRRIEKILEQQPAVHDVVINSWMPPGIDFTSDIRAANGAVIMYVIQNGGATGIPTYDANKIHPIGQDVSYKTGNSYETDLRWDGPSTPEIRGKMMRIGMFNDDQVNGIRIQRRFDQPSLFQAVRSLEAQESKQQPYPWEKELEKYAKPLERVSRD